MTLTTDDVAIRAMTEDKRKRLIELDKHFNEKSMKRSLAIFLGYTDEARTLLDAMQTDLHEIRQLEKELSEAIND